MANATVCPLHCFTSAWDGSPASNDVEFISGRPRRPPSLDALDRSGVSVGVNHGPLGPRFSRGHHLDEHEPTGTIRPKPLLLPSPQSCPICLPMTMIMI